MLCANCGQEKNKGNLFDVQLKGTQALVCADCYSKVREGYRHLKKCEDCGFWKDEFCKKLKTPLAPDTVIGYTDFFAQAESCEHYITAEEYRKSRTRKAVKDEDKEGKKQAVNEREVIREKVVIVKIRCSYCRNLYDETLDKCPHCGAKS
jgi:ribosome-binding protein aMBF1 (putative translation factor)